MKPKEYLSTQAQGLWHKLIDNAHNIVVMGHSGPDGDAMGSILSLTRYLKTKGKHVTPVTPNPCPDFLRWLPGIETVVQAGTADNKAETALRACDLIIYCDFSVLNRVDDLASTISQLNTPAIVIDHHINPQIEADLIISDTSASATCEIVASILYQLDPDCLRDKTTATCLYCGIMTDTGAFAYNSDHPEIFIITALLMQAGIDRDRIYRNVYYNYSESRMRLLGHILKDNMIYVKNRHAAVFTLTTEEMRQYNFVRGDAEGIVNLPLQIKGTRLSISLREDTEKPLVRVSLRSVGDFPCNKMAEEFFNGGGHLNAAGGTLPKPISQAIETALKAIEEYSSLLI